jgi:hypothetical protein
MARAPSPPVSLHASPKRREHCKTCVGQPRAGGPGTASQSAPTPVCGQRQEPTGGKKRQKPLPGVVCLLTTGVLIRVGRRPGYTYRVQTFNG